MTTRPSRIPIGSWPARMPADLAAGYCGETTTDAFLKLVGKEYPDPIVNQGRRRLWLKTDLDKAIGNTTEDHLVNADELL